MPPTDVFVGQTFTVSGRMTRPQKEIEELIRKHGGVISSTVSGAVTFLVTTEEDVKACSHKVAAAKGRGLPMVQEGFLVSSIAAKKLLDPALFSLGAGGLKRKAAALAAPAAAVEGAGEEVKEGSSAGSSTAAGVAPKPVDVAEGIPLIAKSGLAGKAQVVQTKTSKGFIEATLTWDVELVLSDPAKAKDKFYCMQLLASTAEEQQFWVVQHWGRTGCDGRVHLDGPLAAIEAAKLIFKKKYRQRTGNVWGNVGGSFCEVGGKYTLVKREDAASDRGRWQFYMHNVVNEKAIAWYDYKEAQAADMEKYWLQYRANPALAVRFITTDYFVYEIDFEEMVQTNTKSGTRRAIRRIALGDEASEAPPASIPEARAPVRAPKEEPASSSAECEDEDGCETGEEADEKPVARVPVPEAD